MDCKPLAAGDQPEVRCLKSYPQPGPDRYGLPESQNRHRRRFRFRTQVALLLVGIWVTPWSESELP